MDQEFKDLLKEMQQDIRGVTEKIIEISVLYRQHESISVNNTARLDKIEQDVLIAKGAISTLRVVGAVISSILLTSGISFCVWIVSSNLKLQQDLSETNKDLAILNSHVVDKGGKHESPQ